MKLAIQIIPYKSSGHIQPLLDSLKAQTFRDFEIWFWDNSMDAAESDRTRTLVLASGLPHQFTASETNNGFAGGHDAMYRKHHAPFVMLLNDDAKLESTYLEQAMKRIESDPKIGSVTGLVYRFDHQTVDTSGLEYKCLAQIVDRDAGKRAENREQRAGEVFGVSGAVGLYRRSSVDTAGGLFDPSWFMYKEDVDLALRLREAGFTAWYEPAAVAWHKRGLKEEGKGFLARLASERSRSPLLRTYSYANQWRLYRRHWRHATFSDRMRSTLVEAGRSLLVFFASPRVFFRAWNMILYAS